VTIRGLREEDRLSVEDLLAAHGRGRKGRFLTVCLFLRTMARELKS
jgi:hypothetical protein